MLKKTLFFGSVFFLIFFSTLILADTEKFKDNSNVIGSFQQENRIEISSQTGIDKYISYSFKEINNTHWLINFIMPQNIKVKNYPLISLTDNIIFSKSSIDQSKENSFYIIFPNGFKSGESAKFGIDSTIINTTTSTPFLPSQRAICRGSNNWTHAVFLANSSTIAYSKSSNNGVTWNTSYTLVNSTGQKYTPSIDCDGGNVSIIYMNRTVSSYNFPVYVSINNGTSFSLRIPTSITGITFTYSIYPNIKIIGQNLFIDWVGNDQNVYFLNSSNQGATYGTIKTIMPVSSLPECISSPKTNFIYWTYGFNTMEALDSNNIFVVANGQRVNYFYNVLSDDCEWDYQYYNYSFVKSTDGGATWTNPTGIPIKGTSDYSSSVYLPSMALINSTYFYITSHLSSPNDIYITNSTNGLTLNTPIRIDTINASANKAQYPIITTNSTGYPTVFWHQDNSTTDRNNVIYRYFNGTAWLPTDTGIWSPINITTNFLSNQYPNAKWNYSDSCIEFLYINGTGALKSITYSSIGTCNYTAPSPVSNTCTYGGSGDWLININDNCTLSSSNTVTGNIYIYGSNGMCNFQANQLAHAFYYNVSSLGTWYYNNFRWLY